jgi:hypothetical protein
MSTFEYYWALLGLPVITAASAYYLRYPLPRHIRIKGIVVVVLSTAMALFMWSAEVTAWLGLLPQ